VTGPSSPPILLPVVTIAAVLLQIIIAPHIAIGGVVPNIVLVAVVLVAMRSEVISATIVGFVLGLVFDLATSGPVGGMSLVMALLSYGVSSFRKDIFQDNWVMQVIVLLLAAFAGELLHNVLYSIIGYDTDFLSSLLRRALPGALYDSLVGLILFPILQHFANASRKRQNAGLLKGKFD
jgi:rod shape-determining protein MreD